KNYYKADEVWVITNNYFTQPAINLAYANNVILIDRDSLIQLSAQVN
ncbi:restriction endonuclease, partial [Bacillus megaterium NBRC 15308 = ATCC 14581]|nr:restriction endonuclease [Priestia megaterium NBRC 15308 = ATCC 14581]